MVRVRVYICLIPPKKTTELDLDWRTHAGFLSEADARDLETEVARSLDDPDDVLKSVGQRTDEGLAGDPS